MDSPNATPKILVAPLDWGLGHATRCIPIVRELLAAGCTILLGGSGKVKTLLSQEFPSLRFLPLPGYGIRYSATAWGLPAKIVAQIPKIISVINCEHQWLQRVVEQESIDAVISDNRYGLHHPKIVSVMVTHQLRIKAPAGWMEDVLQQINYHYLNKFNALWVPDAGGENNLAGKLSHPQKIPRTPLRYIGGLSRFGANRGGEEKHLLVILSGPEPQRSLLENLVVAELKNYTQPTVLVRGLPQGGPAVCLPKNCEVHNHLTAVELEEKMRGAIFVISRCGYSTVMDIAALKKKGILIPTPGQTEQEYLAKHLMKKNFALCIEQKKFRLKAALGLAADYFYKVEDVPQQSCLATEVNRLLKQINATKAP